MLEDRDLFDKILTFLANILRVNQNYKSTSLKDKIPQGEFKCKNISGPTYPPPSGLGHNDRQADIMSDTLDKSIHKAKPMGILQDKEIKDNVEDFKLNIRENKDLENYPY